MSVSIKKTQYRRKSHQKKRLMKGGSCMIRLLGEFKRLTPHSFISINPELIEERNGKLRINAVMTFPSDSVYHGGTFNVKIIVTNQYPFKAPEITITTPIYHPSVNELGEISYRKLYAWSPAYSLESILSDIQNGLYKFDTENIHIYPKNEDMYKLFTENRPEFDRLAKEHLQQYALV